MMQGQLVDAGSLFPQAKGLPSTRRFPLVLFLVFQILLISLWVWRGEIFYLPLAIIGSWILYLCATSLLAWIPLAILGHAALFFQRTEGVAASELVFAIFFYGMLILWLVDALFVKRQKLLSVPGDRLLLIFLMLAAFSIVPAAAGGNKLFLWVREFVVFAALLFYFPLREALATAKGRKIVYGAFLLVSLAIAMKNLYEYRSGTAVAMYVWQLLGARQTANEPLFMAVILAALAVWMTSSKRWAQVACLFIVPFFSLSLIFTFSRGYWLGTLLGAMVLLLLGNRQEKRKLLLFVAIVALAAVGVIVVVFSDIFLALLSMVARRFFSATTAASDRSLANRLVEAGVVWDLIMRNPIIGAGLGAEYSYYHLLRSSTQKTLFVHNGYLYLWFKLGIFGLLVFLGTFLAKISQGVRIIRERNVLFRNPFVLASTAILIAMLQVSFTSPQFYARDSVLIICICWATIAAAADAAKN
jgi:O-antigen ligase